MLIYLILLLLFVAALFVERTISRRAAVAYLWVIGMLALAVSGFRDMIGGFDVYIYGEVYELQNNAMVLANPGFEYGFRLYYILLRFFSENRYFMFFVSSAIIIFAYGRTLKRYAYWPLFAAFVLFAKFFLMSFVYVRQEVAMAVLCFSIPAIVRRQPVRFALFMLVAFSLHKSALIFAPVYFVGYRRFTNVQIVYLSIVFLVLALSPLGSAVQNLAAENIDDGKVNAYLQKSGALNLFYVAEAVLILGLALALRKRFYGYKETTLFFNGMFMYAVIVLMSAANATFVRFSWYYLIFLALALSYTVVFLRPARRLLFNGIAVVYFSALFLRLMLLFDNGDFMPYKSIFQDFDRKGRWEYMEYRR